MINYYCPTLLSWPRLTLQYASMFVGPAAGLSCLVASGSICSPHLRRCPSLQPRGNNRWASEPAEKIQELKPSQEERRCEQKAADSPLKREVQTFKALWPHWCNSGYRLSVSRVTNFETSHTHRLINQYCSIKLGLSSFSCLCLSLVMTQPKTAASSPLRTSETEELYL